MRKKINKLSMSISSLIYLNLNDKMVHTIAVAYRTHSHLLCLV